VNPNATAAVCTAGAILRENGKKLHTGTHPDLIDPTTGLAYTYLVGVYDVVSGISGFINPNAPYFSVMTTDKSYQDDLAAYQVDAASNAIYGGSNYLNTNSQILGPSVNTAGSILTIGRSTCAESHASVLVHTPGYIIAGPSNLVVNPLTATSNVQYGAGTMYAQSNITSLTANIYASNGTVLGSNLVALSNITANTGDLTVTAGRLILNGGSVGVFAMSTVANVGSGRKTATVTATNCRTTSQVFLTYGTLVNEGLLAAVTINNGSFTITSTSSNDQSAIRWMLVN